MNSEDEIKTGTEYNHNPTRQVHLLREGIQLGKKPLGIMLGAGCPLAIRIPTNGENDPSESGEGNELADELSGTDPLIPDISEMTDRVIANLKQNDEHKAGVTTLVNQLSESHDNANIEDYLTHLRTLISISGGDEVRGLQAAEMESLEIAISDEIYQLANVSLPAQKGPYHHLAQWIGAATREHGVELFTTNYDLLIEEALEEMRIPYFDGFIGARNPFFDPFAIDEEELPSRWAGLWKLHGSISWKQDIESKRVSRGDPSQISGSERRLIHPSHLKYDESRRMPYLAMFDRLKAFIRRSSSLLVTVGFSFNDEHLNEVIRQGLERNTSAHCFGLLFGCLSDHKKAVALADRRSNLSLLARDEAVIGGRRSRYLTKPSDEIEHPSGPEVTWDPFSEAANGGDAGETEQPDALRAHFRLGDFALFGSFLEDMIGPSPGLDGHYLGDAASES